MPTSKKTAGKDLPDTKTPKKDRGPIRFRSRAGQGEDEENIASASSLPPLRLLEAHHGF